MNVKDGRHQLIGLVHLGNILTTCVKLKLEVL